MQDIFIGMRECNGNYFILNGELKPAELFDSNLVYNGESIYEVIRLMNGRPLFFNDHMERLHASVRNQNNQMLAGSSVIAGSISKLIESGDVSDINIKLVFNYKNGSNNWLVYFIESSYPSVIQYNKGVKGILYKAERISPDSKIINQNLRADITNRLISENAYEALLVNRDDLITEGSRSNVFFIRKNILFTAPDELILKGITRKHIIDICERNNITVRFECVNTKDMAQYDAAFMTGTSPMVLPYSHIDDVSMNVEVPLVKELHRLYVLRAEESVKHLSPEL